LASCGCGRDGRVTLRGEIWAASARAGSLPAGARARVVAVEGLRLHVEGEEGL
jgi:membrane protein implicated in regulation of membrane protease activity